MSTKKETKKIDALKPNTANEWHNLSLAETAKKLAVGKDGLTGDEAKKRLKEHGLNKLPERKLDSALMVLLRQFKNSLTYILLVASGVSFALEATMDAYVILAAVGINVVVGFIQEYKAEHALAALRRHLTHHIWVVRDGKEREVEASDLVSGDIVILSAGTKVPADGRLFEAEYLKVNEAVLTGESEAAEKTTKALQGELVLADRQNLVFSGTIVTEGRGKFFVTETGVSTEIGKIAKLVGEAENVRTPLQVKLDRFSRRLGLFILGLSATLLGFGLFYGYSFKDMFATAVAIAVAAIPESLIIVVTMVLAVGMQRILKKGSLVRKLVAAETLGSTNIICVDKTGTLTLGEMRVVRLSTNNHEIDTVADGGKLAAVQKGLWELRYLHQIAINCNNAVLASAEAEEQTEIDELTPETAVGSPTEKALLLSAVESGFSEKEARSERPRFDEVPFDSAKKYMATLNKWTPKQNVVYLKGAPEKIIEMASYYQSGRGKRKITAEKRKDFLKKYEKLSKEGLRVLAAAYKGVDAKFTSFNGIKKFDQDMVFVGFWGLKDPLRENMEKILDEAEAAGLRTIMITGDNKFTAKVIAKELGMRPKPSEIIDGAEIAVMSDAALNKAIKTVKVFSRATPADKLRIVNALQAQKNVVAMTGDGVNDAPALRQADIGVAVGSGTDVAKETADLVLLDDNFATIVAAIREGRVIFDNIRKVILYLLANSLTMVMAVVASMIFGWPLPLLAAQILWINLVTDGLPDLALTQEPEEPEIMLEPPQKRDGPILDFERKFLIGFISVLTGIVTIGIFYLVWQTSGDVDRARTVAFTAVGVGSLLYVFSVRSIRRTIFETKLTQNRWLMWAVGGGFLIQIIGVYVPFFQKFLRTVPLGIADWILILFACFWVVGAIELAKSHFITEKRPVKTRAIHAARV